MFRKNSYYVDLPSDIEIFIKKDNNYCILFIKGPLGTIMFPVLLLAHFEKQKTRLVWNQIEASSRRQFLINKSKNNSLKKLLKGIFARISNKPCWSVFKLIGRGYKVLYSPLKRKIHLEVGYTQKKIIPIPKEVNVLIKDRYNFELCSTSSYVLKNISKKIQSLRPLNVYTGKGIIVNNQKVTLKQGKKTQY